MTNLLARAPSMLPHMEPEPSKMMASDAGSPVCAWPGTALPRSAADAKASPRQICRLDLTDDTPPLLDSAFGPLYSGASWFSEGFAGLAHFALAIPGSAP